MAENPAPTHVAYVKKFYTPKLYVWLEIGRGRLDASGEFHGMLDRMPIRGFDGYTRYLPIGRKPPEQVPDRPDETDKDEEFG